MNFMNITIMYSVLCEHSFGSKNFFRSSMHSFLWVVNNKSMLVNETSDLEEAKTDLREPSFPKLGRNSIFIEGYGYCFAGAVPKGLASLCYNQHFCSLKLCTTQVKNYLIHSCNINMIICTEHLNKQHLHVSSVGASSFTCHYKQSAFLLGLDCFQGEGMSGVTLKHDVEVLINDFMKQM